MTPRLCRTVGAFLFAVSTIGQLRRTFADSTLNHLRPMIDRIQKLLGNDADALLKHTCTTIPKESLHLPGPDYIDRVLVHSDRSSMVLRNMQSLYNSGRLAGTGYISVLPVDQGIEHSAGA